MLPCRALPVPFCFHGFLPPPLFSARVFTQAVPYTGKIHNFAKKSFKITLDFLYFSLVYSEQKEFTCSSKVCVLRL